MKTSIIVMAKAPVAGRVKTRLHPPLSWQDAARLAEASLRDTLRAVLAARVDRCILALDGPVGGWLPDGVSVIPQRGRTFGDRLSMAIQQTGGPAFLIGMDTPQVTPGLLDRAVEAIRFCDSTAALGLTEDGGWWGLGVHRWRPGLFTGVPMSTAVTGASQIKSLLALDLEVSLLPQMRDVDLWPDVLDVIRGLPGSNLARVVEQLTLSETIAV